MPTRNPACNHLAPRKQGQARPHLRPASEAASPVSQTSGDSVAGEARETAAPARRVPPLSAPLDTHLATLCPSSAATETAPRLTVHPCFKLWPSEWIPGPKQVPPTHPQPLWSQQLQAWLGSLQPHGPRNPLLAPGPLPGGCSRQILSRLANSYSPFKTQWRLPSVDPPSTQCTRWFPILAVEVLEVLIRGAAGCGPRDCFQRHR